MMTNSICTTRQSLHTVMGNAIAGTGNLCKCASSYLFDNPKWEDSRPSNDILLAEQGVVPGVGLS